MASVSQLGCRVGLLGESAEIYSYNSTVGNLVQWCSAFVTCALRSERFCSLGVVNENGLRRSIVGRCKAATCF